MDAQKVHQQVSHEWDATIVPTLIEYCKIPNQSPSFDPAWATNGLLEKAANLLIDWVKKQNVEGLQIELSQLPGRTPLIFAEVAGKGAAAKDTVLLYGHLDKQPPLTEGWVDGTGPYTPVIKDGKLYARGGADDGYAIFSAVTAIKAVKSQGHSHARCVLMIEAGEESGSPDLMTYVEHFSARIGTPSLIVCLDSGCANYDQLWLTSSLRGLAAGVLTVKVLTEGLHSGAYSGVVPSSFRIIRMLLARLEDENTGKVLVPELHGKGIPPVRVEQSKKTAETLGPDYFKGYPLAGHTTLASTDLTELHLNRAWRPTVSYTGVAGMPTLESAGNVLRPYTSFMLSIRVPPNVDADTAAQAVKRVLEKDPPYGATVTFDVKKSGSGWESPVHQPWLEAAVQKASAHYFNGKPCLSIGEGGSIPFMGMLGARYPQAQFVITGVLGPNSNAHGPNEFLHIEMGKRVTSCVADILAAHASHVSA